MPLSEENKQLFQQESKALRDTIDKETQKCIFGNVEYKASARSLLENLQKLVEKIQSFSLHHNALRSLYISQNQLSNFGNFSIACISTQELYSSLQTDLCSKQKTQVTFINFSDILDLILENLTRIAAHPRKIFNSKLSHANFSQVSRLFKTLKRCTENLRTTCCSLMIRSFMDNKEFLKQLKKFITITKSLLLQDIHSHSLTKERQILSGLTLFDNMVKYLEERNEFALNEFDITVTMPGNPKVTTVFLPQLFYQLIFFLENTVPKDPHFSLRLSSLTGPASLLDKVFCAPLLKRMNKIKAKVDEVYPNLREAAWQVESLPIDKNNLMFVARMQKAFSIKKKKDEEWCETFQKTMADFNISIDFFKDGNKWYAQVPLKSLDFKDEEQCPRSPSLPKRLMPKIGFWQSPLAEAEAKGQKVTPDLQSSLLFRFADIIIKDEEQCPCSPSLPKGLMPKIGFWQSPSAEAEAKGQKVTPDLQSSLLFRFADTICY